MVKSWELKQLVELVRHFGETLNVIDHTFQYSQEELKFLNEMEALAAQLDLKERGLDNG